MKERKTDRSEEDTDRDKERRSETDILQAGMTDIYTKGQTVEKTDKQTERQT